MRALAKVVQQQGRQHQAKPGIANRLAAKVAHIGVQRLGAGQRQHHRAQGQQTGPAVIQQKFSPSIGLTACNTAGCC